MLIIKIQNDGKGTNESAHYFYMVSSNEMVLEEGHIRAHNRNDGWQSLVEMILKNSSGADYFCFEMCLDNNE